jgi:hypothetical protein
LLIKVCNQIVQAQPLILQKQAGERKILPVDSSFRYLRFRAIGNMEIDGFNGNHDSFPYEHFEDNRPGYGYKSFINKNAHYEHNSADAIRGSIGSLPDAFLNRFIYLDDSPKKWANLLGKDNHAVRAKILNMPSQKDGYIEVLMAIDTSLLDKKSSLKPQVKQALERIIRAIDTGQKLSCSMGCNVQHSVCSACGTDVRFAKDYCKHLSHRKGGITIVTANEMRDLMDKDIIRPEWLPHICVIKHDANELIKGASNKAIAVKNGEINHELSFFELSVVAIPAYAKGVQLEKLARQNNEERKDYLRRIAKEFGPDSLVDLYEIMQENGIISNQCMTN